MTDKSDAIFKLSADHQRVLEFLRDAKDGFQIIYKTADELLLFELQEKGMADVVDPQKYPACWHVTPHGLDTLAGSNQS